MKQKEAIKLLKKMEKADALYERADAIYEEVQEALRNVQD